MEKIVWLILKPILIDIGFTMLAKLIRWALNSADKWMLAKVRSTDTKFDDVLYETFKEHKDAIEAGLSSVLRNFKGEK